MKLKDTMYKKGIGKEFIDIIETNILAYFTCKM